jgi:hypothetical protein
VGVVCVGVWCVGVCVCLLWVVGWVCWFVGCGGLESASICAVNLWVVSVVVCLICWFIRSKLLKRWLFYGYGVTQFGLEKCDWVL